ncbi:MAG: hypothetical protein ACRC62_08785 [Microcoleus sp.]
MFLSTAFYSEEHVGPHCSSIIPKIVDFGGDDFPVAELSGSAIPPQSTGLLSHTNLSTIWCGIRAELAKVQTGSSAQAYTKILVEKVKQQFPRISKLYAGMDLPIERVKNSIFKMELVLLNK